jgi:polyisoprenoid-binding protein YceI
MVSKSWFVLPAAVLALGACDPAPAAPPAAVDTAPTVAAQPTAADLATAADPATAAPAATDASAAPAMPEGARTYSIEPSQSKVTYEVGETLFREGNRFNLAIGTTNTLNGEITIDYANPANSSVGTLTVDISQFRSDSDRRDGRIREEWLESARFPMVTVVPTSLTGIPADAAEGQEIQFQLTGDTTVRDSTRPLTFDVTAKLDNDTLTGTATTQFKMTDFGFQPPDIAGMLKAEDDVTIKIEFTAFPN